MVKGGEDYFSILEKLIAKTEHELHFQTYIFDNDETGARVAKALIAAAGRGVDIYMVLDAYGSKELGKEMRKELLDAGIKLRFFGSVYTGQHWAWGRRLHHKIVVADRCHALVGGINVSNNYAGTGNECAWLDFALLIDGPVGKEIFKVCRQIYAQWYSLRGKRFKMFEKTSRPIHPIQVQLCLNDWLRGRNQIAQSYMRAIRAAKKEIIIANSYFFPGRFFRQALKRATKRGVRVKLLLPGMSDIPMVRQAMRYLYDYLLRYDIEVYEWTPGILHAKVACADGKWCTVGSYNLNYLSAYASIEFNINVLDAGFCGNFGDYLTHVLETECTRIVKEDYLKEISLFTRFINWCCYEILKLSAALLITFPGQRFFSKNKYM